MPGSVPHVLDGPLASCTVTRRDAVSTLHRFGVGATVTLVAGAGPRDDHARLARRRGGDAKEEAGRCPRVGQSSTKFHRKTDTSRPCRRSAGGGPKAVADFDRGTRVPEGSLSFPEGVCPDAPIRGAPTANRSWRWVRPSSWSRRTGAPACAPGPSGTSPDSRPRSG